ncbi:alpha-galactosidase [Parabacteroides sp. Marseille-P3160]|uniref:alpha-galactosidase n=1 Tax=Parabacteroides sp. Marseille-P3160 TaxID=1917887 RepID=UPI0009BA70E5|nr:alpha-galactosidase [Parabacteroides sp. Marseille-P3160]
MNQQKNFGNHSLYAVVILFLLSFISSIPGFAGDSCYSYLSRDTMVIGNNLIERKFYWNKGNLITHSLTDKENHYTWFNTAKHPDFLISGENVPVSDAGWSLERKPETEIRPACLESQVVYTLGKLQVKRVYRIYEGCPAIACDTYLKGETDDVWVGGRENQADLKNIESTKDMGQTALMPILDQLSFPGRHWNLETVEFFDVTDRNNTLVKPYTALSYRKNYFRGNLLFARNEENEKGLFFLKEAPCSSVQLSYPEADFISEFGQLMVTGLGIDGKDLSATEWTKTYSTVLGVYAGGELNRLAALRLYQKQVRKLLPERDEMVMMNTWGDRSQDKKVNEAFCLKELETAAKLGISHFQIDDGWQSGKSANSAFQGGSFKNIWSNPDYWKPDKAKYPDGLGPIVQRGKKLGIEVCLWFNPSYQNDYEDWEKDAAAMIDLYKRYGIRTFKIDGLIIPNKLSEIRVRKIFDKVLSETGNQVVFNLDATAGRRGGYFFFNEYGNIFLENRYTDWTNYYPYWTLRNLWMLSKYVPAEKIQVEFLNKWRNGKNYGNDPFAPANYSFDYLFAITMAGQPLAWMEGTGLPAEAFPTGKLIEQYRTIQHDFHEGIILPIGEEPSGKSWTGFQSLKGKTGYLLVYREKHPDQTAEVKTWFAEGQTVDCTPLFGKGEHFTATAGKEGMLNIHISNENDFVIYAYSIR